MVFQTKQTLYKAFGFTIHSDISFPELQKVDYIGDTSDIVVSYADLGDKWIQYSSPTQSLVRTKDTIMFIVPNVAIFSIQNGSSILISPFNEPEEDKLRLYVLGSCMGALLFQRKILPLHGSTVVIDGQAYAFVGHSGHGKSTLASSFLQKGYQLITDDVIAVSFDSQNVPYVIPAYPQQKLWQESLDTLGMNSNQYRPLFERETKFAVPVHSQFTTEKLPLAEIFELSKTDCNNVEMRSIEKLERLSLLYRHTYRKTFLEGSGLAGWHFDIISKLAGSINMYQLKRPLDKMTVDQLTNKVLNVIEENKHI